MTRCVPPVPGCTSLAVITAELRKWARRLDAIGNMQDYTALGLPANNPALGNGCGPVEPHGLMVYWLNGTETMDELLKR